MRVRFALPIALSLALGACDSTPTPEGPTEAPAETPATEPASPEPPVDGDPTTVSTTNDGTASGEQTLPDLGDPDALYQQCRERVEGVEADGECTTDADCATGGCSQEICATPKALEGIMSTCEARPCFQVLDACGCNEGRCTWSVKADARPAPGPFTLPDKDSLPTQDGG